MRRSGLQSATRHRSTNRRTGHHRLTSRCFQRSASVLIPRDSSVLGCLFRLGRQLGLHPVAKWEVSVAVPPCSASFRMPMIWVSVHRLRLMGASEELEAPVSHGPKNRSHVRSKQAWRRFTTGDRSPNTSRTALPPPRSRPESPPKAAARETEKSTSSWHSGTAPPCLVECL